MARVSPPDRTYFPESLRRSIAAAAKVKTAVTDPARIHPRDPGHPEVCTVYAYHKAFNEAETPAIDANCREGRIGCVACKKSLPAKRGDVLGPIQERRRFYEERPDLVREILIEGTRRARSEARQTMELVRAAIWLFVFQRPLSS